MDDRALPTSSPRVARPRLTTAAVMVGTMVSVLGTSTINVALTDIMHGVNATIGTIDWVVTAYMLAMVIAMPLTGWLDNVLGRRNLYLGAIGIFTVGSMLAGLAWDLPSLVAFRLLQGLGGGLMMPTAQAILFSTWPPEKRGTAMGLFGLGAILGPAIGPTVGGWLVHTMGWRSLFYLNVPFSLLAVALLFAAIGNERPSSRTRFDAPGFALLVVALASLQLGLGNVSHVGWTAVSTMILLGTALVMSGLLWWRETHTEHPIIHVKVFRHGLYNRGTVVSTALGAGLYGGTFLLPLFLGSVHHRSAMEIGLIMLPGSLVMGVAMLMSGRLSGKLDTRLLVVSGLIVFAGSLLMLARVDASTTDQTYVTSLILRGVGVGMLYAPLSVATLSPLDASELGGGSGLFNLTRQLGGTVGIALLKTVLSTRTEAYERTITHADALSHAFDDSFLVAMVIVACCVLPALFLTTSKRAA